LNRTKLSTLTKAQRDEWKKVLLKSHEASADRINKDLLQAIYKETGVVKK
jgi:C4-dicarboxylate-binding protein DctP